MSSERPLKIGYVLKKYPRLSETFILNEILGMEGLGHEVDITSLTAADEGRFHADLAKVKAPVRYLPAFGSAAAMAAFDEAAKLAPGALERAMAYVGLLPSDKRPAILVHALLMRRAAREKGLDHLHAHFATVAAHVAATCRHLGGPTFSVTAHAKDIYRDAVDRKLFRATLDASAFIVTVCEANRRWIEEKLLDGPSEKIKVIYNGLPLEGIRPGDGPREPATILGVGRLVEKKGFPLLIESLRILRDRGFDARVEIIGDGEDRSAIAAAVDRLGMKNHAVLLGARPREEVLARMRSATLLAAPCLTGDDGNRDALPTVLIEALACGLPSVSTPVGGIEEIVDDGVHGYIVPEKDVVAFADAVAKILGDAAAAAAMREKAPGRARERFDRNSTLPKLVALMRKASGA